MMMGLTWIATCDRCGKTAEYPVDLDMPLPEAYEEAVKEFAIMAVSHGWTIVLPSGVAYCDHCTSNCPALIERATKQHA